MTLYQLPPVRKLLVAEAVARAGLLKRDQAVLDSADDLRLATDDPPLGVC